MKTDILSTEAALGFTINGFTLLFWTFDWKWFHIEWHNLTSFWYYLAGFVLMCGPFTPFFILHFFVFHTLLLYLQSKLCLFLRHLDFEKHGKLPDIRHHADIEHTGRVIFSDSLILSHSTRQSTIGLADT